MHFPPWAYFGLGDLLTNPKDALPHLNCAENQIKRVYATSRKEVKETQIESNDIKEICHDYFRAVKTTISNLQRYMRYNTIFTLDSKFIYIQDKKILNTIRRHFYNDNYQLALEKANSLLANKLRDQLFTINCLIYGPNKWKRGLLPEINEKLNRINIQTSNEKTILNNLDLLDLTKLCLNLDEIAEQMFISLFGNENWKELKTFLFLEKDLQKINGTSTVDRNREEILIYLLQIKAVVEKNDSFYFMLLSNKIPFLLNYQNFEISIKKEDKALSKYDIKDDILGKIKIKINEDGFIELDFTVFIPNAFFQELNFVDWIMYLYHMKFILKSISINITPNGKIIIT